MTTPTTFFGFITRLIGFLIGFVLLFAFVGVVGSCLITLAIWPGQLELLAPILCSDAQPDAFVVADTTNPTPGETATNFTLYCMGPRGDSTDVGFLRPFLMISVVNGLLIMIPIVIAMIVMITRFRSRLEIDRSTDGKRARIRVREVDDSGPVSDPADHEAAAPDRPRPPPGSTSGPFVG